MSLRALFALFAVLALAGCATTDKTGGAGDATPAPMSTSEARSLLQGAIGDMPQTFAVQMQIVRGSASLLYVNGTFDNATHRTWLDLHGDAATLSALTGGQAGADLVAAGFGIYSTPEGSAFVSNHTAFVFPPTPEGDAGANPGGIAKQGELGTLLGGDQLLQGFGGNATVKSVTPTVYRGKAAMQIVASGTTDGKAVDGTIVVFASPRRVAHIETALPASNGTTDPFSGATLLGDFFYDGEVSSAVPETALRAMAMRYNNSANPLSGGAQATLTWTFQAKPGLVTLAQAQLHAKSPDGDAASGDLSTFPDLWTKTLAELPYAQDGVTIAFTDADHDGKLSLGDTLTASGDDQHPLPTLVLKDLKTGLYVVPSAGLALLLAGLGVALLVARRAS